MTDLNSTSTNVVVGAGQTLNILSGGTAVGLTNHGTVNGFRLSNSGGEVLGDFTNFSLMQASGTNAFLFLSTSSRRGRYGGLRDRNASV